MTLRMFSYSLPSVTDEANSCGRVLPWPVGSATRMWFSLLVSLMAVRISTWWLTLLLFMKTNILHSLEYELGGFRWRFSVAHIWPINWSNSGFHKFNRSIYNFCILAFRASQSLGSISNSESFRNDNMQNCKKIHPQL